jgi:YafQ family addiction module toxin component
MYNLEVKKEADEIFRKLSRKNPKQLEIIDNKIKKIRLDPYHNYKFLHPPLNGFNRVHLDTSFVLIFKINHETKTVIIYYFDHHDKVYKWNQKKE